MTEPHGLPDGSNFFSSVRGGAGAEAVRDAYARAGWSVRACGRAEWEAASPFAELVVEGADPVLVHGAVADIVRNAERAVAPLSEAGIPFHAECYGADGALLAELRWTPG
ncbi:MAG: hypothetical protein AB1941_11205 [Gemmatimonadota bacterium]